MNNTKLSSAAHGLNVMKTLMPTLTSKAQNASSGMSFAETLISVRTRVQTVSVTTTNTSTEMTMTEYKSYIYGKISDLPVNPTQASRSASVFISDEGFAAMKDSSEYEDWVLGKLREDFALSNPLCERTGSYVVYQFGAKKANIAAIVGTLNCREGKATAHIKKGARAPFGRTATTVTRNT